MKSATAITYELDDIVVAAKELTTQIKRNLTFGKYTVAILHGQPEMETGELSAILSCEFGCKVIGGTTAGAALLTNEGYHELAVVLHVLTSDDCLFATAISNSMTADPLQEIHSTYQRAYQNLKRQDAAAEPQLVMCIKPILQNCSSDNILTTLAGACGNLPIFGYVAADDYDFSKQQVFLSGVSGGDRMAVLLLSGNVRPIFQVENLAGRQTLEKRRVTKAHDNVICEIDGQPAYEYIKNFPFIDEQTDVLWHYQFFVEMENAVDNDGASVSRALNTINKATGEVTCFANVPQDSSIGLLYCNGKDVAVSSETALRELMRKITAANGGYEYSTLLIASCSLRNMFLADLKDTEGNLIKQLIPPNLTVSGLYAFGEIAPTSIRNGQAVNRFHNATFTMCAF